MRESKALGRLVVDEITITYEDAEKWFKEHTASKIAEKALDKVIIHDKKVKMCRYPTSDS